MLKHPPDLVNHNQIRARRYANITKIRVPYKKQLYNNINKVLKNQNIIAVSYIKNNLSCVIRKGKDKIEKEDNVHNIYQLKCNNCQYTYVGQCKRALKIRLKEHTDSINDCTDKVVALHCNDNKHKVNWKATKILDREKIFRKRQISEMVHIKMQNKPINDNADTKFLNKSYSSLISNMKK